MGLSWLGALAAIIIGMVGSELDGLDAPVCPLLGLVTDRRSHFTFPNPGHRCFATGRPREADARRQTTYCLGPDYSSCDRYRARSEQGQAAAQRTESSREPGDAQSPVAATAPGTAAAPGTVIHVFREGDALANVAKKYGVAIEDLMMANGITFNAVVPHGTRLVIPMGRAPSPKPGPR